MAKKIVKYTPTMWDHIRVGDRAIVFPTNHDSSLVSNESFVTTSIVVSYSKESGEFETENSLYVPA